MAFKYEFDRLAAQKMEQVYEILLSNVLDDIEKDKKEVSVQIPSYGKDDPSEN